MKRMVSRSVALLALVTLAGCASMSAGGGGTVADPQVKLERGSFHSTFTTGHFQARSHTAMLPRGVLSRSDKPPSARVNWMQLTPIQKPSQGLVCSSASKTISILWFMC